MINEAAQAFLQDHWRALLGAPYVPGGDRAETGFDCWGFVRFVYRTQGVILSVDVHEASARFARVEPPYTFPDVLMFKLPPAFERHVAVALDDQWFIHCSLATNGVARCHRGRDLWRQAFRHGVRLCS